MIQHGADDWNRGMVAACRGNFMSAVQLMIQHGANDWETGLYYACADDNIDIVKELIHLCPNVNCVKIARKYGSRKVLRFLKK